MDEDGGPYRRSRTISVALGLLLVAVGAVIGGLADGFPGAAGATPEPVRQLPPDAPAQVDPPGPPPAQSGASSARDVGDYLSVPVLIAIICLLSLSAFFSGSETAFFSLGALRIRALRLDPSTSARMVARLIENSGQLLTTILMANMIVNVLIGVVLGTRVEDMLSELYGLSHVMSYVVAVAVCTSILVFFGEITPKIFAVQMGERFARVAVFPMTLVNNILAPIRNALLALTELLFRVTRLQELHAAPFITDEEIKSLLAEGEVESVLEEDERQMIQGILTFADVMVGEILVPRPDVIAIAEDATVADAVGMMRENDYSRMPVYRDNLDTVTGLLVLKDLLPSVAKGDLSTAVKHLARTAHFVPATMTVQQFVNEARRHRTHLAVVVDEYGGTEGIVTLEDAMEEVVGDIMDEDEQVEREYEALGDGAYRVDGSIDLDDLNELLGLDVHDEEHTTVAGLLMNLTDKIAEPGDQIEHAGLLFTVESCEGKRASSVRIEKLASAAPIEEGTA